MIINSVLLVPSRRLLIDPWRRIKNFILRQELPHHAEIQYAGDLPSVLGHDQVFVLGQYYPHVFSPTFPARCSYPSCHGAPRPVFIKSSQLASTLKRVDAVIISAVAWPADISRVTALARRQGLPIAILDIPDYDTLYGDPDLSEHLTLNFKSGRDYDLYFKKDLPLGFRTDRIFPFGPIPVRPASYQFRSVPKIHTVFYNGRKRLDQSSPERAQMVQLVQANVPGSRIVAHDTRSTYLTNREYWDLLSQSRIALSPSGRCWDSFRHCEIGLAPDVALLLPRPFIETCGPPIKDGFNAIVYDVELRQRRYYLADADNVKQKISYYLDRPAELSRLAKNWQSDVLAGHTIEARSRYLIDTMREHL